MKLFRFFLLWPMKPFFFVVILCILLFQSCSSSVALHPPHLTNDNSHHPACYFVAMDLHLPHLVEGIDASFTNTSVPRLIIQIHTEWAPLAAARFHALITNHQFYDDIAMFRVIPNAIAQFGIHGDPKITAEIAMPKHALPDEEVAKISLQSNRRGTLCFAANEPHSRNTQIFINLRDNVYLDDLGFHPFGEIVYGQEWLNQLYSGYGEGAPIGKGPVQDHMEERGNEYLRNAFPHLSWIQHARIISANEVTEAMNGLPRGETKLEPSFVDEEVKMSPVEKEEREENKAAFSAHSQSSVEIGNGVGNESTHDEV